MSVVTMQRPPKIIAVAKVIEIKVDQRNQLNCYLSGWENRGDSNLTCPGISTILDGDELECNIFSTSSITPRSIHIDDETVLYQPNNEKARWGKSKEIKRCEQCIIAEQRLKS